VLLVLVIGLIMVFVGVERAGAQAAIVEERIRDYQRHHEMLGVRDLIAEWLQKPGKRDALIRAAQDGATFFDAALPGNLFISARAEDAQGAVRLPDAGIEDPQVLFALNDLVSRLPPDRADLVRAAGAPQVSLSGAPEPVLRALAAGDDQLFAMLRAMQAEPMMDSARFVTSLSTTGMTERATELSRVLTFTPTLFRLRVRVDDGADARRYSMLADLSGNAAPVFRSLRFEFGGADEGAPEADPGDRPGAPRRGVPGSTPRTGAGPTRNR